MRSYCDQPPISTGIVNLGTLKSPATDVEHKCYWKTVVPEAENSQCGRLAEGVKDPVPFS